MVINVAIVDYGTGNLHSVMRRVDRRGVRSFIASCHGDIENADKIVLPGVGHFGRAMNRLNELGFVDALNEAVLFRKKPVMGICLGMELMAVKSEEGDAVGLGWFEGAMVRFPKTELKVPQIGWNTLNVVKESRLMTGVPTNAEFCFIHSYHLRDIDPNDILSETTYGLEYPSAIERDNIFGVQFHPEKSFAAGDLIFANFLNL